MFVCSNEAVCIFCKNTAVIGVDGNVLTKRGLDSVRKLAEIHRDSHLQDRLSVSSSTIDANTHKTCFSDYTNKRWHEQVQRNKSAEDGSLEPNVSLPKLPLMNIGCSGLEHGIESVCFSSNLSIQMST